MIYVILDANMCVRPVGIHAVKVDSVRKESLASNPNKIDKNCYKD
jgi:hypothetical protein